MDIWILILLGIFLFGVIVLYMLHREPHHTPILHHIVSEDNSGNLVGDSSGNSLKDKEVEHELIKPYAKQPIDSVDDYEYSMIFKNEGDRAMTKETRDLLMSQYPMDWSTQPPSSAQFQRGLAAFKEAFTSQQEEFPDIYRSVDGTNMIPPESDEMKEREVLATYVPKKPQELTTYDIEDAKELIEKIYAAKGLKASYKQTGKNQFTVMNTRPLKEEIKYEEEYTPASSEAVKGAGEGTIIVPEITSEVRAGLDPFFTPGEKTRDRPWDYTRWTPGLERMFAPSEPRKAWF